MGSTAARGAPRHAAAVSSTYLPVALEAAVVLLHRLAACALLRSLVRRGLQSMDWLFARFLDALGRTLASAHARHEPRGLDGRLLDRAADVRGHRARNPRRLAVRALHEELLGYLPSAIGGVIIIVIALVGGTLARHILEQASVGFGIGQSSLLGRLAQGRDRRSAAS